LARFGYRAFKKATGNRPAPLNFERHFPRILSNTSAFIVENIKTSPPLNSTAKLKDHFSREKYDAVVVGSDQTWRPCYSPNIENFFLDFIDCDSIKRYAYASSFGVDNWEFTKEQTERCAALAKKFDVISVREKSGIDLCRNHLGVKASHVLDPTLLLQKDAYEALFIDKKLPRRSGVYTYILDDAQWKARVVETVTRSFGKKTYSNQPKCNLSDLSSSNLSDYEMPSIEGWLQGFFDADFIVTDSFHGTVFSVIFEKPFISLINAGRGATRFFSLADELGVQDRILEKHDEESIKNLIETPVDFEQVRSRLGALRKTSEDALFEMLPVKFG